jgi:hypothetical protein
MSYEDYQATTQTIPFHVATLVSENYPLCCAAKRLAIRCTNTLPK